MTILAFYCILHSLCQRKAFQWAQNTASVYLLPKKQKQNKTPNTFNNIEIKWLHFALHYRQAVNSGNTKGLQASVRSYLQTPLELLQGRSWMCVPERSPTKCRATQGSPDQQTWCFHAPDDSSHSVGNPSRQLEA